MPNIQRPFVWSEEQIARLFDSIMREYPIGALLVWKTKEKIKHRKFIDNYHYDIKLTDFYMAESGRSKFLVLDGQQRLQSLFIGLKGSYASTDRVLYFDVLSGDVAAPEDIRYRFAFIEKSHAAWPWVPIKDIISANNRLDLQIAQELERLAPEQLSDKDRDKVQINIARARQEFVNSDNITFQELDGIDNPDAYEVNDIVEIFIRANSGGTKLGKSDLLFSLLVASWEDADGEIEGLLEVLNQGGFEFDRDFVLKSCLTVLNKGARYDIGKFRDGTTKEEIISKWITIADAIKAVRDFVVSKTYIHSDKALPSYLALIPLIYYRYHYPEKFKAATGLQEYLLRSLVTGVFGGSPDNLIDKIVRNIQEHEDFVLSEIFGVVRAGQSQSRDHAGYYFRAVLRIKNNPPIFEFVVPSGLQASVGRQRAADRPHLPTKPAQDGEGRQSRERQTKYSSLSGGTTRPDCELHVAYGRGKWIWRQICHTTGKVVP